MVDMKRLDLLCKEKKWSRRKLEREVGISVGSIIKWKTVEPLANNLSKVASVLSVSTAFLTGDSEYRTEHQAMIAKWARNAPEGLIRDLRRIEEGILIPVFDYVPEDTQESIIDAISFEPYQGNGDCFGLMVESYILIVRKQNYAESGNLIISNSDPLMMDRIKENRSGNVIRVLESRKKY